MRYMRPTIQNVANASVAIQGTPAKGGTPQDQPGVLTNGPAYEADE